MKILMLFLFIVSGCSVSHYYQTSDVTRELQKNAGQLNTIAWTVDKDFRDKSAFYDHYLKESKNKDTFIIQDLFWRLSELKNKRDLILRKSSALKEINDGLLVELNDKKEVRETDPAYKKIETFAQRTNPDVKGLFGEFANYKTASSEFAKFALFTGNIWKKSTSSK